MLANSGAPIAVAPANFLPVAAVLRRLCGSGTLSRGGLPPFPRKPAWLPAIAIEVGYSNRHFARLFRKETGLPPTEYRRQR